MANPNIVNVTSIIGKTSGTTLGTSLATVLTNAASSGKIYKINSVIASNKSSAATVAVDVGWTDSDDVTFYFIKNLDIPPDASLITLDKNNQIYVEENRKISAKASGAGSVDLIISYEEIS